jgi:hypothetical protein
VYIDTHGSMNRLDPGGASKYSMLDIAKIGAERLIRSAPGPLELVLVTSMGIVHRTESVEQFSAALRYVSAEGCWNRATRFELNLGFLDSVHCSFSKSVFMILTSNPDWNLS